MKIAGLPTAFPDQYGEIHDLSVVPSGVSDPTDPLRDEKRAAWIVWRNLVRRYRIKRLQECRDDPKQQAIELQKCKRYGATYWITVFAWSMDPREDDTGRPVGSSSFVPYPGQVDLIRWIDERLETRGALGDGLVSKSRDMGATTICCLWALHGWLFKEHFRARFMSRNKEAVDKSNDPDTIFSKIDFAMERLPSWMLPQGYDREAHRMDLRLKNPENGNTLAGDAATKSAMRGRRATVIFFDEGAFIPNFLGIWTSAFSASYHRVVISTESIEMGEDFYALRVGKDIDPKDRPAILELDWWTHIEHDQAWYEDQKSRSSNDPEGFAREVERNPHAGFGSYIYELARSLTVIPGLGWEFGMPVYVGIDPGFDDECALNVVAWDAVTGRYRAIDAYANRLQIPEYYASLLTGMPDGECEEFHYLARGPYDPELFAHLMRQIDSFTLFGDPNGTHRITGKRDSWYDKMNDWAYEHARRELPVIVGWDPDQRIFSGRRSALQRLLPRMDFNDTPGCRALLRALQEYRFESHRKDRQAEQLRPLHNANSHPVAALEYIAVNIEQLTAVSVPLSEPYATADSGSYATS